MKQMRVDGERELGLGLQVLPFLPGLHGSDRLPRRSTFCVEVQVVRSRTLNVCCSVVEAVEAKPESTESTAHRG